MHRSLRMLGILMDLQSGPNTLGNLAEKYECSSKTIQRDITALTELNIPVRSAPGINGGISLKPGWMLGPLNLDAREIETLLLALEASPHLPATESTLAKIRAASTPSRFDEIDQSPQRPVMLRKPAGTLPNSVEYLRNIIRRDLWCKIEYDGGSKPGLRLIKPVELRITEGRWYLFAIDERSQENRWFRIDRITNVIPGLAPRNGDDIVKRAQAQPEYRSEIHPMVEVKLTLAGERFCADHTDFFEWTDGDMLRFRCPPREYRYYAGELLRMGRDCRVIAPFELIQEMRTIVSELASHLENNMDTTVS